MKTLSRVTDLLPRRVLDRIFFNWLEDNFRVTQQELDARHMVIDDISTQVALPAGAGIKSLQNTVVNEGFFGYDNTANPGVPRHILSVIGFGTAANNGNTKTLTLSWGGATIAALNWAAGAQNTWYLESEIWALTNTTQKAFTKLFLHAAVPQLVVTTGLAINAYNVAQTLLLQGQSSAGAGSDLVLEGWRVELFRKEAGQ